MTLKRVVLISCIIFLLVKDKKFLSCPKEADKGRGVAIECLSHCICMEPFEIFLKGFLLIKKVDYSVINENGKIIAKIYYDLPVFIGNKASYKAINKYYEERFRDWLESDEKKAFMEEMEEMREAWGDEVLASQPFVYAVDTKIMLLNSKYLSIMQIDKGQTAGPSGMYYSGDTFNLDTGESIPFDVIVETDADSFRTMLAEFLRRQENVLLQPMEDVAGKYESREDHSWVLNGEDSEIPLNYNYFYDGEYVYIILNNSVFSEQGCLLKWNQHKGDQAKMTLMNYFGENADELYEYYY